MTKKDYTQPILEFRQFMAESILAGSDPRGTNTSEGYNQGGTAWAKTNNYSIIGD